MDKLKKVGLLTYDTGNIGRLINTLKKFDQNIVIIKNVNDFNKCNKIILPGVGSFNTAINFLKKKKVNK